MRDDVNGLSDTSESALEESLRHALSEAAPRGFPTIGVREKIVGSVRERVRRRQRLAGALAACCVVIGGASVGVASWHATQHPGNTSAAPLNPSAQRRPGAASAAEGAHGVEHSNCGEIVEGSQVAAGCYGIYARSSDLSANSPLVEFSSSGSVDAPGSSTYSGAQSPENEPPTGTSSANSSDKSAGAPKSSAGSAGSAGGTGSTTQSREPVQGAYRILVPVGRSVTVMLPGSPGEIWSAPAVAPGQGAGANKVRIVGEESSGVGQGSSASFESDVPVTVLIDASSLPVCGSLHIPCGSPTATWTLVIEFQKS